MTQLDPQYETHYAEPPAVPAPPPSSPPPRPVTKRYYRRGAIPPPAKPAPAPARNATQAPPTPPVPPEAAQTTARPRPGPPAAPSSPPASPEMTIPHDLSAEAAVLGSMIIDPKVISPVCMFIQTKEMFFKEENQIMFQVIYDLFSANSPIDGVIIHSTLKSKNLLAQAGGIGYLTELANAVPTSSHAEYYAAIVASEYAKRQLISIATRTLQEIHDGTAGAVEVRDAAVEKLSAVLGSSKTFPESVRVVGDELYKQMQADHGPRYGILTGIPELDSMTLGLHGGNFIIVAARPGVGKSALVLNNILRNVAIGNSLPAGLISMEMSKQEVMTRLWSQMSGVDSLKILANRLTSEERKLVEQAKEYTDGAPLWIDDSPSITPMDLTQKVDWLVARGVKLVALDYLQLMSAAAKGRTRQEEISLCSRTAKTLAMKHNIPIIGVCQLNRGSEKENRAPRNSDLRDSGSLEQDANVIILLHREPTPGPGDPMWVPDNPQQDVITDVMVTKCRHGRTGTFKMQFRGETTEFMAMGRGI